MSNDERNPKTEIRSNQKSRWDSVKALKEEVESLIEAHALARPPALWYFGAMFGEPKSPFSLTHAALTICRAQKRTPINSHQ
jgi:hypothetical protein